MKFYRRKMLILPVLSALLSVLLWAVPAMAAPDTSDGEALALLAEETVTAFLEERHDEHFFYYPAEEYQVHYGDIKGSFGGVGIQMLAEEGGILVHSVLPDTPAADSPIRSGDIIESVDGIVMAGMDTTQAASYIRGEVGSEVTLALRRADGVRYTVTLVRAVITSQTVTGEVLPYVEDTIYISMTEFADQTLIDFVDLYNTLSEELQEDGGHVRHLILDLRSNLGGSFRSAVNIANYFVAEGEEIVTEKTAEGEFTQTSNLGSLNGLDIVVLQNMWTASSSEVLAGVLQEQADACLIGDTTYGKGITQAVIGLADGSGVKYTRGIYYLPSGFSLHGIGIEPDVPVPIPEGITSDDYFSTDPERNPQLAAAIDHIRAASGEE